VQDPKFLQGVITLKHFDGKPQKRWGGRRSRGHHTHCDLVVLFTTSPPTI
jgi:hypothetical protein